MGLRIKKRWLLAAALLLLAAVAAAYTLRAGGAGKPVNLASLAQQDIRPSILASGTLAYRTEVQLTAEVTAKVKELLVAEGDDVEKGQVLLRLDPQTYRNAIDREDASRRQNLVSIERQRVALELRRKQFERTRRLFEAHMIDNSKFDEDRNQLQLAEVELKATEESLHRQDVVLKDAREQLGKTDIRAPMTGRVVALPIKVGETAIPSTLSFTGAQLLTIADTSALQAELKVDEGDIARISEGQTVDIYPAAWPDLALKGVVDKVALTPTVENNARAYKVTVKLAARSDIKLRSGMSCRSVIYLGDGGKRLAVPVEAILSEETEGHKTRRYLMRVVNSVAEKREVQIGISDDRWQEVKQGAEAGDSIVIGPSKDLRELKAGDKVTQATGKSTGAAEADRKP